ncbi:MAG: O-methyltransferase [Cyanobacteria bacterium RYN_339]|nr:O-methyltransferase [Cyanobacteria bacterium RYN_339]
MSNKTLNLTDDVADYLWRVTDREHPVAKELRAKTATHPRRGMQICPEQGQLMMLLLEMLGAKRTLEIGVFTGYSSLITALALPEDGVVTALDISDEYTREALPFWEAAGVAHKIDLRLAPATETLDALLADGRAGTYDFAFIDADKENYGAYYERALQLLRVGGLIAIDNVLWGGSVADPQANDPDTAALKALNEKLHGDARVTLSMVPIGDGLTLVRKR